MSKYLTKQLSLVGVLVFCLSLGLGLGKVGVRADQGTEAAKSLTLRVGNWEEYIDLGNWGPDELIDLDSGEIRAENSLIADFCQWYEDTYGIKVKVEYSTFGTNEDLYNMLSLGDSFDLICPSEYMFMKLMSENALTPLSAQFFAPDDQHNYYSRGVSPFLKDIFDQHEIAGEPWSKYAAGYMWGITGFIYNPEEVSLEEAQTWKLITNPKLERQVTIKANIRDSYFAAVGAINSDLLTSAEFINHPQYRERLEDVMNNTSPEEIALVQEYLQQAKDNVYAFETDSGKADMITGKVLANYQWSGDAVYTMDQAEEDGFYLDFAVPLEATNIYFDAWVMLNSGIQGDPMRQHAAEAFINFLSRPDNAIRNMYYIGYSSFISGGDDPLIFDYLRWNYEADEQEIKTLPYDVSYFFTGDLAGGSDAYVLQVDPDQIGRQLTAQYPSPEVMHRSAVMRYFPPAENAAINLMWINVRCYNINNLPVWAWFLTLFVVTSLVYLLLRRLKRRSKLA